MKLKTFYLLSNRAKNILFKITPENKDIEQTISDIEAHKINLLNYRDCGKKTRDEIFKVISFPIPPCPHNWIFDAIHSQNNAEQKWFGHCSFCGLERFLIIKLK